MENDREKICLDVVANRLAGALSVDLRRQIETEEKLDQSGDRYLELRLPMPLTDSVMIHVGIAGEDSLRPVILSRIQQTGDYSCRATNYNQNTSSLIAHQLRQYCKAEKLDSPEIVEDSLDEFVWDADLEKGY